MEVFVPLLFFWTANRRRINARERRVRQWRGPRKFKPRCHLTQYTKEEIKKIFRLDQDGIEEILDQVKPRLETLTKRSYAIPAETKLLGVLHYLASGAFQYCAATKLGYSQPSFSRFFPNILDCLVSLASKYIRFPRSRSDIERNQTLFFQKAGIPDVVALIDCTHISLIPSANEAPSYQNRKLFYSLNVQIACGPDMRILDVVAKFPGRTHDAYILENSRLGAKFVRGDFGDAIMLGDNGYRNCSWLLTPYLQPQNRSEQRFNQAHRRTRGMIERVFGLLKSRFRALDITGGALLYSPEMVGRIIVACCVLHNVAIARNVTVDMATDLRAHIGQQGDCRGQSSIAGQRRRQLITSRFFQ